MKLACHAVHLVDPVDVVDLDDSDVWQGERRVEPAVGVHHSVGHSLVIIITIMSIIKKPFYLNDAVNRVPPVHPN